MRGGGRGAPSHPGTGLRPAVGRGLAARRLEVAVKGASVPNGRTSSTHCQRRRGPRFRVSSVYRPDAYKGSHRLSDKTVGLRLDLKILRVSVGLCNLRRLLGPTARRPTRLTWGARIDFRV